MGRNSISPASITNELGTHFVGQRVIYYPRLSSTMVVAKQEAQLGAAEGTVIIAGEQTAGKGRLRRIWLSPRGSIALSVILYPRLVYLPSLIMLASLAVVRSIEKVTGLRPQVKWPNDVLVNGRKVCGILIENDVRGDIVACAIIGIGVNVNLRVSDYPEILPFATSLSDELGGDVSLLSLIQQLLVEVEGLYLTLQAGGSIYEEGKAKYEGVAESVTRDGSLLLRQSDGGVTKIVAGDVTLRN